MWIKKSSCITHVEGLWYDKRNKVSCTPLSLFLYITPENQIHTYIPYIYKNHTLNDVTKVTIRKLLCMYIHIFVEKNQFQYVLKNI